MTEGDTSGPGAPRQVAGYPLLRPVGQGGMSAVYQSYDVAAGRPVAVKLLADHLAGRPEFVGRFYREARLSKVLEHPGIVQGYASGYDPDVNKHYLVLEFIDGPTAHAVLARLGRLPASMVARIGIDIAQALAFLHDRQYVHRDVKPDNILLPPSGAAKLADLGLAKRLNDDSQLTAVHQGVGTTYYMPYEQAVNANLVDGRSDIFALGATLYHLLTGEVPFGGATHDEVIREKAHGTFRPVRAVVPDAPASLARLIEAMLACDPRHRTQRIAHVVAALTATGLAAGLPAFGGASGDGPAEPTLDAPTRADFAAPSGLPPAPGDSLRAVEADGPAKPKRGVWPWVVGAGTVLLALAAGHARTAPLPGAADPPEVAAPAPPADRPADACQ